jgi:hypothetical protein
MDMIIVWWCNLIGVGDPLSVKIASGMAAAASLMFCIWLILRASKLLLDAMFSPEMNALMDPKKGR